MARLGLGVALVQIELAQQELASGALVRLDPGEMPIGHPYCAVTQPGRRKRASVEALLEVLRNSSRNS